MKIERVDAANLDRETAEQMAAAAAAELAGDRCAMVPPSPEGLLLQARHGHDGTPQERLWVLRADDDRVVGYGVLEVSHWDNPKLAMVFGSLDPAARGQGAGTLLLDAQLEAAGELGRSSLLTFAVRDSRTTGFLLAHDFAAAQYSAQRRLDPEHLDYENIQALADDAAAHAADYELVRLDGPPSDDLLPGLTALFEAINDAPLDDMSSEQVMYPVERVRRYHDAMAARRQHVYGLAARHRPTGELVGHTIVCVDETRPGYAAQEDTSVLASHRGHRLGMLLKASMLLWLRDEQPGLRTIDTWNAVTNDHMIAVNDALGCRVVTLGVALQRSW